MKNIELYNDDCRDVLDKLITSGVKVDAIVTSPPYDDLRKYNDSCKWDFDTFKSIAQKLFNVLVDGGIIVWVVGDQTINGSETGTSFKQALYFKEIGFNIHDTMIWQKTNPMPKVKTKRYFDVFEYMFIFTKGTPRVFNPILVDCRFGGKVYDSTCKNMGGENGRTKKNFVLNEKRYADNIWQIAIAQNKTGHPAVFPLKLAENHIKTWSNKNDIILDPFMGSGTTGIACKTLGRRFIGIEIDDEYFKIAKCQIENQTGGLF